jgi:triacylglycerol lipase
MTRSTTLSTPGVTPEVLHGLRQMGRESTPETIVAVTRLLAPLHEGAGFQAPHIVRNLDYGPDARHRLDVHGSGSASADQKPVLVFVHGGGFIAGDKSTPGEFYYDHVGAWAVQQGMVAVTMTYRLAPQHRWPAAAEDIAQAMRWVHDHIAEYRGSPTRVVLVGHSAGAAHVASYVSGHGSGDPSILAGAVMISGLYDPAQAERNPFLMAYYGDDPAEFAAQSALPGLLLSTVPVLFGVAELDVPDFHRQATILLDAMLATHSVIPPFVVVADHTHLSAILALGLDEALGASLSRFVHRVTNAE